MTDGKRERLRPVHVFALLMVLVVLALIFAPDFDYGESEMNLTTYSAGPFGARGFYQTVQRLGWPVERRVKPFRDTLPAERIYLLLAPPIPVSARETGALLDAVRRGAALFIVPSRGTPLADSLGVTVSRVPAYGAHAVPSGAAREWLEYGGPLGRWLEPVDTGVTNLPDGTEELLYARTERWRRPAIAEQRLGEGRVLLVADPAFLANSRFRDMDEAVLATRLLEWLERDGERRALEFAEWHHGSGAHPGPVNVLGDALLLTAAGRAVLVLAFAGGVLLLALGARPVAPEPPRIPERRSPFEHVGALSLAYRQIGATRLATRHLVRGLWRRRSLGAHTLPDERQYLLAIRARFPRLAPEIDTLLQAMERKVLPADFVRVGEALHTIERTLTS